MPVGWAKGATQGLNLSDYLGTMCARIHSGHVNMTLETKQCHMVCGSLKSRNMGRDQRGTTLKLRERTTERGVSRVRSGVELVMRRHLSRGLPDGLHRVQLRRVGWQPMKLDLVSVAPQPLFSFGWQVVPGCIVNDEKDLALDVLHYEPAEKRPERFAVEDGRKPVGECCILKSDHTEKMRRLALSIGIDPRLAADGSPGSMQGSIQPEARLVFEQDYAATRGSFFLIAGRRFCNQYFCSVRSARARRLRGRWTENPRRCSRRGM